MANTIASDVTDMNENFDCLGYTNIPIPAGSMAPLDTNGAIFGSNEYATNDIMKDYFAFSGATEKFVSIDLPFPENWNRSTFKVIFYWAPGDSACTAGDKVEWKIGGLATGDGDAIDTAIGTTQVITDTVLAGKNTALHITSATPAITLAGSPALLDEIYLKISRNVGSANDDMTENAWLFKAFLQVKINEAFSAW